MVLKRYLTQAKLLILGGVVTLCCFFTTTTAYAATGKLTVVGNKVVTSAGRRYIPEGISVYGGLEARNYTKNTANVYAQIKAAAIYWHANTIRLQVADSDLFSNLRNGQSYNPKFLSVLKGQVTYAQSLGMAVVINDQTEFTSRVSSPTKETARFWQVVASQYKTQPYVIFDLFNEPRLTETPTIGKQLRPQTLQRLFGHSRINPGYSPIIKLGSNTIWKLWRDGGMLNGTKYLGMQALVNQVRATGASNIIWAQGAYGARQLPPNHYLLQGSNIVYAIHHPNLNNPRGWKRIGTLAATRPVVEGEWAQYESRWAECYSDAYENVPKYLNYLHAHQIGIIAWSLQADSLLRGNDRFSQPTNLNTRSDPTSAAALKTPDRLTRDYSCGNQHGQGAGQLIQNYFAKNSVPFSLSSARTAQYTRL